MGNSAGRAWQPSQLAERVLTAFNPSHGSLSCVETNCVSFASAQARKLNRSVCFSFPHKVATLWGPQLWPDIVCPNRSGRPRRVSRSPEACFWVVARAVRVSQPAVLSALLVIQLFGIVIPPPNFSKEHQKERCDRIMVAALLHCFLWCASNYSVVGRIICHSSHDNARTNVCQRFFAENFFLLMPLLDRIASTRNQYEDSGTSNLSKKTRSGS